MLADFQYQNIDARRYQIGEGASGGLAGALISNIQKPPNTANHRCHSLNKQLADTRFGRFLNAADSRAHQVFLAKLPPINANLAHFVHSLYELDFLCQLENKIVVLPVTGTHFFMKPLQVKNVLFHELSLKLQVQQSNAQITTVIDPEKYHRVATPLRVARTVARQGGGVALSRHAERDLSVSALGECGIRWQLLLDFRCVNLPTPIYQLPEFELQAESTMLKADLQS
ncbi:MAG: hypothetical protein BWK72_20260 [Rhodoferax ferrireducens]|uniref:Uncharacterized protein n=1 Tax=Rhodoferax ferrireducens TaxID=192843 RepID=A0A1W9KNV7_9BURK|nr:MAG: hypothetical protein BWK72_20260 [Rhodoferax ferrireducens]